MPPESDNDLASLLRAAGVRVQGPEQMSPEVRAAVEAEWQATRAARARRRRRILTSTIAALFLVGAAAWLARPLYVRSDAPIAAPTAIRGTAEYRRDGEEDWRPLTSGVVLMADHNLRTGPDGRVQLRLVNDVTLVLDSETRVAIDDLRRWGLRRGALYVATGPVSEARPRKLWLKTPAGRVRHSGAQYEARIVDDEVRLSVRAGHVIVAMPDGEAAGAAGERLTIEDSKVTRQPLAPDDATFDWLER